MTKQTSTRTSRVEVERKRAARRDGIPIGVTLVVAVAAFAVTDPNDPGDTVIWAVPMLVLGVLGLRAEVRDLRRADEYQRTLQLEALALGFVVVSALLFLGGLLTSAGVGDPRVWLHISLVGGSSAGRRSEP